MSDQKKIGRRNFLGAGAAGVAGLTLLQRLGSSADAQPQAQMLQRTFALNHNWLFSETNVPNATRSIFNDANFCSGDRICYHGVSDIFRIPKPAAGFYKSQCDPSEEVVLEPAFDWARGDENETFTNALVCSNCEKLKFYIGERLIAEVEPDRKTYSHLKYAPFVTSLHDGIGRGWNDLRIEGYIGDKKVIERKMSGRGADRRLLIEPDDRELVGDGIDMTRVVMKVTDEFGAVRPFANEPITLSIEGPGEIIGENPFALFGGVGAVWIQTKESPGIIRLTAKHQTLGSKSFTINVRPYRSEAALLS